jgi:hypothetical protein
MTKLALLALAASIVVSGTSMTLLSNPTKADRKPERQLAEQGRKLANQIHSIKASDQDRPNHLGQLADR